MVFFWKLPRGSGPGFGIIPNVYIGVRRAGNRFVLRRGSRPVLWPGNFFHPPADAFVFADLIHYSMKLVPVS